MIELCVVFCVAVCVLHEIGQMSCMCVCVYVYVYVQVYVHVYVYVYVYIYTHIITTLYVINGNALVWACLIPLNAIGSHTFTYTFTHIFPHLVWSFWTEL